MKNEKVYSLLDIEYYTAEEFLERNSGEGNLFNCKERVIHQHEEFVGIDMILEGIQAKARNIANESVCGYTDFTDSEKMVLKKQIAEFLDSHLHGNYCTSLVAEEYTSRVKELGLDEATEDKKTYMNIKTGTVGGAECWMYENEEGELLDGVKRGEVVEVVRDENGDWTRRKTVIREDGLEYLNLLPEVSEEDDRIPEGTPISFNPNLSKEQNGG